MAKICYQEETFLYLTKNNVQQTTVQNMVFIMNIVLLLWDSQTSTAAFMNISPTVGTVSQYNPSWFRYFFEKLSLSSFCVLLIAIFPLILKIFTKINTKHDVYHV